jgi:AcrR family transcriptional regulator
VDTATHVERRDLRDRIVEAAAQVIRERGLAGARTRAIAEAAGCAEGSIYRYFPAKVDVLLAAVRALLAGPRERLVRLPAAGTRTVEANLLSVAQAALAFYRDLIPLAAGVFADAELQAEQRAVFLRGELGLEAVAAYLRAELRLGRVRVDADPVLAARLLLGGCLGESFFEALAGSSETRAAQERHVLELVAAVAAEVVER